MRQIQRNDSCPCGSGQKFKRCCSPYLEGAAWPETPEALMRSRYSAYVTGNVRHLFRTTHPENEAVRDTDLDRFSRETLPYCRQMEFTGLTVHETWPPDLQGVSRVRFTASYRAGSEAGSFTELSEFVQVDGKWLYRCGEPQQ